MRDATKKERHVCARRRGGEAAGSSRTGRLDAVRDSRPFGLGKLFLTPFDLPKKIPSTFILSVLVPWVDGTRQAEVGMKKHLHLFLRDK